MFSSSPGIQVEAVQWCYGHSLLSMLVISVMKLRIKINDHDVNVAAITFW